MFFLLLPIILLLVYLYFTKNHDYWEKRNVKHERPIPFFGNLFQNVIGTKSMIEISTELYNKYPDEKVVGLYHGTIPELIIRDLDLVRKILNVDFVYFHSRGLGRGTKLEPVFRNLFHAEGDEWKLLRQRLTPAFTTAKLKKMFPLVVECAEKLLLVGEDIVNKGGECDVRELMARFSTEFIGACGFGLQMDSINNENSIFRNLGRRMFNRGRSRMNVAFVILYELLPDFRMLLQIMFKQSWMLDSMKEIFEGVRTQRNSKPSGRHDFIDLLLELQQKGKITGDSIHKRGSDGKPLQVEMEMDVDCMAAQVFAFFAAGFETSSSATSYMLHELAFNPEEQTKIQEDIDRVLAKYDNKLCYDSIAEMKQLSMGFKEAMRKFPSLGTLNRVCCKRYTIPELGISIDPGVKIIIPLQAIQKDEKYFDNPSQYKPERFADTSELRHKYSYMPFGEGARACIGARLGEMQSLAGLAAVLHRFSVEPGPSTKREFVVSHTGNVVQSVKGGLPLKLKLRIYHGPCYSFHTLKHKPQRLAGLKDQLMRLGFRVELVQVDHINYCMIEMCGHDVFRCKLSNLKFNTHCDRDPVCQRAVEAIVEASEKFKQSRSHLQLWALLDDQIFMRGPYAPKDYWPTDIEVKPYVPLQQCLDCCNILVKKKKENVTK